MSESLPPMPANLQGLSIAWFREADWPRWLQIDPEFQPDYSHWLSRAEAMLAQLRAQGVPVIKVTLDPDDFLAWSAATGNGTGTKARGHYAAILGMRQDKAR